LFRFWVRAKVGKKIEGRNERGEMRGEWGEVSGER